MERRGACAFYARKPSFPPLSFADPINFFLISAPIPNSLQNSPITCDRLKGVFAQHRLYSKDAWTNLLGNYIRSRTCEWSGIALPRNLLNCFLPTMSRVTMTKGANRPLEFAFPASTRNEHLSTRLCPNGLAVGKTVWLRNVDLQLG